MDYARRFTHVFLSFVGVVLFSLLFAPTVFATNNVAQVGDDNYTTIEKAIENVADKGTIKLIGNVEMTGTGKYFADEVNNKNECAIEIAGKEVTIDLNGYEISAECNTTIVIRAGAKLTLTDTSENKAGKVSNSGTVTIRNNGKLVVEAGDYTEEVIYAMYLGSNSETTINGGKFGGIYTNGSQTNDCKLTINDGEFTELLYLAGSGTYKIEDGKFTDTTQNAIIEIKRGTLEINGGEFTKNVTAEGNENAEVDGNGSGAYKGTIIVSKADGYVGDVSVTIKGGTFTNNTGDVIVMANETDDLETSLEINGEDVIVNGNITDYSETVASKGITLTSGTVIENNAIAQVGDSKFNTIEEAIENAADKGTIKLIDNVALTGAAKYFADEVNNKNECAIEIEGKEITIDLNGYEISAECNTTIVIRDNAKLTLTDTSEGQTGKVSNSSVVTIRNNGELVIEAGDYTEEVIYAMYLGSNSETTINGGKFGGIYTNGSQTNNCKLTINDGEFTELLYLAGSGTYKIEDGKFTDTKDNAVIEIKRGTLEINGGEFTKNVTAESNENAEVDGNGSGAYKGTIIVSKTDGYAGDVSVTIKGGTFTNNTGDVIVMANETDDLESLITINEDNVTITGNIKNYIEKDNAKIVNKKSVAQVGDVKYMTLEEAIAKVADKGTIKLIDNVAIKEGKYLSSPTSNNLCAIEIAGKEITIDLNGYEISAECNTTIVIRDNAKLTLTDTSEGQTGKVSNSSVVTIRNNGELVIEAGDYTEEVIYAMYLGSNSETTINGGKFGGIYANGSQTNDCKLTINDGEFTELLYLAGSGTYKIEEGEFSDTDQNAVIEIKRGTLEINGGEFTKNVTAEGNENAEVDGNGSGAYKGTIIVSKTDGYAGDVSVTIKGGTFTNNTGDVIVMANESATLESLITINEDNVTITGTIKNYIEKDNAKIVSKKSVAQVGDVKYMTIEEAITNVADKGTIKLIGNVEKTGAGKYFADEVNNKNECAIEIEGKEVTIDLNGYEISAECNTTIVIRAGAKLTLTDTSENKAGKVSNSGTVTIRNNGELVIEAGDYTEENIYAMYLGSNSETTINGGKFGGIYTNGSQTNDCVLTINDGEFTELLYLAGSGTYKIEDGKFTDTTQNAIIEIKRGTLEINGGIFTKDVEATDNMAAVVDGNGSGAYKGTIIVSKTDGYAGDVSVTIAGGTFTNNTGDVIVMANESTTLKSTIDISNATITGNISYYGIKSTEDSDIMTQNNIILRDNVATNNNITLVKNQEMKEVYTENNVEQLSLKRVTITLVYTNNSSEEITGNYQEDVPDISNPTRTGYSFTGWDKEIPANFPFEDVTITASWERNSYGGGGSSGGSSSSDDEDEKEPEEEQPQEPEEEEPEETVWENPFTDVKEENWYYEAVGFVNKKGLFKGMSDDTFGPDVNLTRGMVVTVLYRLDGSTLTADTLFKDVDANQYYKDPIAWAAKHGIVQGESENVFNPDGDLTREQLVTILYRYAKYENPDLTFENTDMSKYEDFGDVSDYAKEAFAWACSVGIINGKTDSILAPQDTATRAEVATVLMRFCE